MSTTKLLAHLIQAIGGILGMCSTIGQGITGIATLEIESFATVNANLAGRAGS